MGTAGPGSGPGERWRIRVSGTVQGVGFRPFVYRHAVDLGLDGFVRNDSAGVLIEAQGHSAAMAELSRLLVDAPPPLARVTGVVTAVVPWEPAERGFTIDESVGDGIADVPVSVDTGTCADCLAEIEDPQDRRFGYPFTNCTNCGPRYTIVTSVPYDRPATTMAGFPMCPECRREYDDPADRRFHAQPNACGRCGPQLRFSMPRGLPVQPSLSMPPGSVELAGAAALDAAVGALEGGAILAIKGVGGFHLAVDGTRTDAVAELRRRKARDDKPFALMVRDVAMARRLVDLGDEAQAILASPRRPIVLATRRAALWEVPAVAPGVAPGLPELGVMLPYSPLHHLLMERLDRPLVLTSGNLSDDPIAYTDDDAATRLGPLVDGILGHDRPIHIRCDDSVVRACGSRTQVLRRSRGLAPEPFALPFDATAAVLAVGAELKATVSVAKGRTLVASHHIGDLEHLATYRSFLQALDHLCHLCGVVPDVIAHDLHPEYLSTKLAAEADLPTLAVQHHHAHVASCLVDHGRVGPVLGVAFDGLGFGPDSTLWGGEFLVADLDGYERAGHLRAVPLPGGAAGIREPWRMAVAWVNDACGRDAATRLGTRLDARAPALVAMVASAGTVAARPGAPTATNPSISTTSMGRLFDAVAALTTGRTRVSYEGQAAIELEVLAGRAGAAGSHPYRRDGAAGHPYGCELGWEEDRLVVDPRPLVRAVVADVERGTPPAAVAAAFHAGVSDATVETAATLARRHGLDTVALTGGVFQNARLSALVSAGLRDRGLEVLMHRNVPANDGGISIGQAAIAAHRRRAP